MCFRKLSQAVFFCKGKSQWGRIALCIFRYFYYTRNTPATKEKQGVWNKEGQMIPCFNDSSKGIDAVAHIRVTADYIDTREGGRIRILKHGAEP